MMYLTRLIAAILFSLAIISCGGGGGQSSYDAPIMPPDPVLAPTPDPAPVPDPEPAPVPEPVPEPTPVPEITKIVDIRSDSHLIIPGNSGEISSLVSSGEEDLKIALGDVALACFNSHRVGWGVKSAACHVPTDGKLVVTGVCNNDRGNWSLWTKDGTEFWLDTDIWQFAGLPAILVSGGQIEYGKYQPAKVSFQDGNMTIDFGSNCLGGFWDPIEHGDLEFVYNSNQAGWGRSSTKRGYLAWDDAAQKYTATIAGLSCGDRGTISVFKPKTVAGGIITWEDNPYTWFNIPDNVTESFWERGTGVNFFNDDVTGEHSIALEC